MCLEPDVCTREQTAQGEERAGPVFLELTQPLTWVHSNHAIASFSSRDFKSFSTSLLSRQDSPDCTGEKTERSEKSGARGC